MAKVTQKDTEERSGAVASFEVKINERCGGNVSFDVHGDGSMLLVQDDGCVNRKNSYISLDLKDLEAIVKAAKGAMYGMKKKSGQNQMASVR